MTNFSLSSALKASALATLAVFAGCGPNDGAKEYDGGVAAYEVRDLKRAEKLFAECLGRNPGRTDALVMMARVRKDLGELALAKEAADKAAALSAGDPDVIALDAEIAYHAKDYARATRQFGEIAENAALSASDRSLGWTGIGIVHQTCIADSVNDGTRDLARVAFLRAIRLDRTNAAARYHLGLLYRDAYGYPAAALEQFELFVRLGDVADARVQKTQRTLIPAVKEDIARRASSLPGASKRDAGTSVTALQKADAAWKKGQYKTARLEYDRAYKADVLSYPAALGLAKAWEKSDATDFGRRQALESYREACNLKPGSSATALAAADLAMRAGRTATAAEFYSRAVAANPGDITAIDGLIRALRKVGGQSKAAAAYQQLRDTIPVRRR